MNLGAYRDLKERTSPRPGNGTAQRFPTGTPWRTHKKSLRREKFTKGHLIFNSQENYIKQEELKKKKKKKPSFPSPLFPLLCAPNADPGGSGRRWREWEWERKNTLASFPLQVAELWVSPKLGKEKGWTGWKMKSSISEFGLLWTRAAGEQGRSEPWKQWGFASGRHEAVLEGGQIRLSWRNHGSLGREAPPTPRKLSSKIKSRSSPVAQWQRTD